MGDIVCDQKDCWGEKEIRGKTIVGQSSQCDRSDDQTIKWQNWKPLQNCRRYFRRVQDYFYWGQR